MNYNVIVHLNFLGLPSSNPMKGALLRVTCEQRELARTGRGNAGEYPIQARLRLEVLPVKPWPFSFINKPPNFKAFSLLLS